MSKVLILLVLLVSPSLYAFELMKCTSKKSGTIWASFGKLYRSGENRPVYFPTEIVLFAPDVTGRLLFPTLEDALKIALEVDEQSGRIHMEFAVPKGSGQQKHLLQLFRYDPRITNGLMGNWTISEDGQPDRMDEAACSVD